MRLTVICPTHRGPAEIASVAHLFAAQRYVERRLVFVENGPAVDVCHALGLVADAVLRSGHSKVAALNTGLDWLRHHGGGAWALWDDDDYYGPGYLDEVAASLPGYDLVGKRSIHVRRNDGRLWLIERTGFPLGHSLAGWSDCVEFKPCKRWGEDDRWLLDMQAAGARVGDMSSAHFVWQRVGDLSQHIWPATDDQIAQMLTRFDRENSAITDYGRVGHGFVDNPAAQPIGQRVELPIFDPMDVPGISPEFRAQFRQLQATAACAT